MFSVVNALALYVINSTAPEPQTKRHFVLFSRTVSNCYLLFELAVIRLYPVAHLGSLWRLISHLVPLPGLQSSETIRFPVASMVENRHSSTLMLWRRTDVEFFSMIVRISQKKISEALSLRSPYKCEKNIERLTRRDASNHAEGLSHASGLLPCCDLKFNLRPCLWLLLVFSPSSSRLPCSPFEAASALRSTTYTSRRALKTRLLSIPETLCDHSTLQAAVYKLNNQCYLPSRQEVMACPHRNAKHRKTETLLVDRIRRPRQM